MNTLPITDGTLAHASSKGLAKLLSNKARNHFKTNNDDFQALSAVLKINAGATNAAGVVCGAAAAVPEDAPTTMRVASTSHHHAPLLDTHSEDELDWDVGQAYTDVQRIDEEEEEEEGGGDDDEVVEVTFQRGMWVDG